MRAPLLCAQDGTFSACTNHPKKGKMPAFPGLTREEEEEEEDFAKLQLLSMLNHKQEHRFFSPQLKLLTNPNFRAKPEVDPEWRPGAPSAFCPRRSRPRKAPPPKAAPLPGPSSSCPPPADAAAVAEETEPSTNLSDFASYFENQ